jgi:hypothetical protein
VTVQTHHATHETELLVDGKVVGHQRTQAGRREPQVRLAADLPGDPPQPFGVTLHTGAITDGTATCALEIAGRTYPMPETPLRRAEHTSPRAPAHPLRRIRRLLRRGLRR